MNALILLFTAIAAGLFAWGKGKADALTRLKEKYRPIVDVAKYVDEARSEAASAKSKAESEARKLMGDANKQASLILTEAREENKRIRSERYNTEGILSRKKLELELVENALRLKSDEAHYLEVGYYEPAYGFEDLESYKAELDKIREKQRRMLTISQGSVKNSDLAAYAVQDIYLDGSKAEGQKLLAKVLKLMLRAFSGECDSFIARVNYKNINLMQRRIESSFDQINKLAENWKCKINQRYLENRLAELELVYEYEEEKQKEKEEQAQIREQIREEEKAAREAAKAEEEARKEEEKYERLLRQAQQEAEAASDKDKIKLSARIDELQKRISEIEEKKRAISQAMLTKTGHVYIISNIGSFGENVYKIGMTRRLEPMDRVKELGDASVPFPFDVHAMIRTSNAPALENALHNHFAGRRLNLENGRKEFFRVSIDEIRNELEVLKNELKIESELRLTLLAEAKEYRLSEAKRKHLEASWQASS
jgi:hypothetical protein